jgi:hypothetical protein
LVAADSIDGKCTVHSLKGYQRLDEIRTNDYFSRFMYKATSGEFKPDQVGKCRLTLSNPR